MYAMSQCQGTSWQLGYCIIKSELQVETIQYNIKCYGMLEYIVCQLFIMITILIIMLYWLFSKETFWLVIMSAMYMIVKVGNTYQLTGYNYFKPCVGNLMARILRWLETMSTFNCMSSIYNNCACFQPNSQHRIACTGWKSDIFVNTLLYH